MNKKSSVQNLVSRVAHRVAHRLALRSDSSALFAEEKARPLVIEALEPRILFSGSPAPAEPAPAESNTVQESPAPAEADASANPAPAQDATVAAPPEATVPAPEGSADQGDTSVALTDAELFSLTDAALGIWAGSGISEGQAAALANATYRIADLGGNILGSAEGNVITIDDDAAGRGWFVDSTPEDNSEFVLGGSATTSIDLLSILLHEQGHLLGLDDVEGSGDITNLMNGIFVEGERRLPVAGQAVGAVAGSLEGTHYAVTTLFSDNFETPDVSPSSPTGDLNNGATPSGWVRATQGFGATRHGITDESTGDFNEPGPGAQAYAFRYTNSGLTTAVGSVGTLTSGTTYTISFDVVRDDGRNAGTQYTAEFVAFLPTEDNAARTEHRGGKPGTILASSGGLASADGLYKNVSFTVNADDHLTHTGKDIGLRFIGATTSAIIDNVQITATTADAGPATAYWDGTDTSVNADGGNGTWNTTATNWDDAALLGNSVVWDADASGNDIAVFGGSVISNVTLGADFDLGGIVVERVNNTAYFIGSSGEDNTLNFASGSTIDIQGRPVTIRAGIGGSPTIKYIGWDGVNDSPLTLDASGPVTMEIGALNASINTGGTARNTDVILQGTSTGNSIDSITWSNVAQQLDIFKRGTGTWTVDGGYDNGPNGDTRIKVEGGTLIVNGIWNPSHEFSVGLASGALGGTLGGTGTISVARSSNATELPLVRAGGSLAPGAVGAAGTLTFAETLDIQGMAGGPGTLNFDLDALASTSDRINVTGPALIGAGLLGFSDFNFTDLGGLEAGTYTLLSTTTGFSGGTLAAGDLTGTIGSFDAEVRISGNNIVLDVTLPPAGPATAYWDGTDTSVNADGGNGTWNTTATNWDDAVTSGTSVVWDADGSGDDTAIFGAAGGTVTLGEDINLLSLTHSTSLSGNVTISGNTLNFATGGSIAFDSNLRTLSITSGITGSPTVVLAADSDYTTPLTLAPTSGTQTLGDITLANDDGAGDKGLLVLGGNTTGNTTGTITHIQSGKHYSRLNKVGTGTWTVDGDLNAGVIDIQSGTLIVNGTMSSLYQGLQNLGISGELTGDFSYLQNDSRFGHFAVNSGGIVAPGDNGVWTANISHGTRGDLATTRFNDGAIYEWEVGVGVTDIVHIARTTGSRALDLNNFTLKIQDAGGTAPTDTDQLAVFTYDTGVTVDMTGFGNTAANFDVSGAGAGWDANSLTLIDDGAGTIYLTGLPTLDAVDDDYTTSDPTDEDTVLNISAPGVLANDNPTDATITASDATSTEGASVTVNPDGSFSYDPTAAPGIQALSDGQMVTDTFTYTISDDGGATTDSATVSIKVNGLNDAPALSGSNDFEPVAMDDTDNMGQLVSELIGTITDVDDLSVEGIAVTAASSSDPLAGKFQFDAGSGWMDVGAVSESDALLLRATDSLRFLPSGSGSATGTLSFKAWDQTGTTAGQQGTKMTTLPDGSTEQTSAFSGETETVSAAIVNVIIEDGVLIIAEGTGRNDRVTISTSADMLNVIIHDAAGPVVAADPAWQVDANTVSIPIVEFDDIEFHANDGDDFITLGGMGGFTGNLTILGEDGQDSVLVAKDANVALGTGSSLTVDGERFTADLGSTVSVLGDGTISVTAAGGMGDFAGLNLRRASLSSEGGGITLTGVGGDTGNTNDGVVLTHGSTVTTGGGSVTITGTATSTTGANDGISLKGGSDITSGTGGITLTGTSSGVNSSYGVQLFSGTEVTTTGGDIAIAGASTAGGSRNAGIYTNGATVTAGGAGSVTMTGTGGGAGSNNNGLSLTATAVDAGTSGDVTLVGMGGGGTSGNGGVQVGTGTSVSADGGNVTITGTGAGTGIRNTGVSLLSGSSVSSGGDTEITGVGGSGTSRNGGVGLVSATVAATGNLTVDGTGNGTGSYNGGISSSGSTLGGAEVMLAGTGSTSSSTGRFNDGVVISKGGVTASGTLTIDAAGGTGSRDNRGLFVSGAQLAGTLLDVTGSADADSGARSTGVFIQNSVLSDDGTIAGTGGGVDGVDGFGVYMRNIMGGANLGVTTAPDTDEEKGGNYFDAVLPAMLLLGAGGRTKARRGAVGASVLDDELQGRIGAAWGGIRGEARTADALRTQSRLGASLLG